MQKTSKLSFGDFWRASAAQLKQLRSLTGASVLAALGVALRSLSIPLGQLSRITFTFLGPAVSGYLYGPLVAGLTATVADVVGFLIRPDGPFFIGFTFNAFLGGFVYGCLLYGRDVKLWRTFTACLVQMLLVSFLLNPLWLSLLYGDAFWAIVAGRVVKNAVLLPINTGMLYLLLRAADTQKRRLVAR